MKLIFYNFIVSSTKKFIKKLFISNYVPFDIYLYIFDLTLFFVLTITTEMFKWSVLSVFLILNM